MPKAPHDTFKASSENCLAVGTRVSDFEISGIIGEGGFGIVYLAFDHSLQRTVAIKEYMPGAFAKRGTDKSVTLRSQRDQKTFATGLKSFINEARLLAQFDHPALIKVYRFWEENNTGYMAMQYYEGRTLKSVIRDDPALITEAWLKGMLKPILEALDALYRVKVLHRDISPDNIMIQDSGEAVLLDFGAARQIIGDMNHAMTVILKPGYAPIEQYADDASMTQGPWTDIYSLSAVVYLAIVKKPPPTSVARMIKDPIERLQDGEYHGFSKEFLAAVDKGLEVKPEDRPQSIAEFRKLLQLELAAPGSAEADSAIPAALPPSSFDGPSDSNRVGKPAQTASLDRSDADFSSPAQASSGIKKPHTLWVTIAVLVSLVGGYFAFLYQSGPPVVAVARPQTTVNNAPGSVPPPQHAGGSAGQATAAPPVEQLLDEETIAWEMLRINRDATPEELGRFIERYPSGKYVALARTRLDEMRSKNEAKAAPAVGIDSAAAQPLAKSEVKPEKSTGTVNLNIKPWGTVFVDGVSKGVSPPLKRLVLPEGKYQIKVVNPAFPHHIIEIDATKKKAGNIEHDFSTTKK